MKSMLSSFSKHLGWSTSAYGKYPGSAVWGKGGLSGIPHFDLSLPGIVICMVQCRAAVLHCFRHVLKRSCANQKDPHVFCSNKSQILPPMLLFDAERATPAQPVSHQLYGALHCCICCWKCFKSLSGGATFSYILSSGHLIRLVHSQ